MYFDFLFPINSHYEIKQVRLIGNPCGNVHLHVRVSASSLFCRNLKEKQAALSVMLHSPVRYSLTWPQGPSFGPRARARQ